MTIGELVKQLGGKLAQGGAEIAIAGVNSPANAQANELVFAEDAARRVRRSRVPQRRWF